MEKIVILLNSNLVEICMCLIWGSSQTKSSSSSKHRENKRSKAKNLFDLLVGGGGAVHIHTSESRSQKIIVSASDAFIWLLASWCLSFVHSRTTHNLIRVVELFDFESSHTKTTKTHSRTSAPHLDLSTSSRGRRWFFILMTMVTALKADIAAITWHHLLYRLQYLVLSLL